MKRPKKRMTDLDIRMVIEEIEEWRKGERGSRLTWVKLERIFPFTRQTMYSKEAIQSAFELTQTVLKTNKCLIKKPPFMGNDLEKQKLKNRIKELEIQVEELQKLWVLERL